MGRVGVHTTEGPYPGVQPVRDLTRDHVDHAAERRRAVKRGACALHYFDTRHVLERDQVPIDPASIPLIRGHAVHEHQHAAAEPLHVARRAADVHLAVEELHPGRLIHCFVHRRDGPAGDFGIGDERHASHHLAQQLRTLAGGDDDRLQQCDRGNEPIVALERIPCGHGHRVVDGLETEETDPHDDAPGWYAQPEAALGVRHRRRVTVDPDHRA